MVQSFPTVAVHTRFTLEDFLQEMHSHGWKCGAGVVRPHGT